MFKQIFENKISEKINNFNNSGKSAIEWMDKFRQSLDITEKIQQQFNYNESQPPPPQQQQPQIQINNSNNTQQTSHQNSNNSAVNSSLSNNHPENVSNTNNLKRVPNQTTNNNIYNVNNVNNSLVNGNKVLSNKTNKTQNQEINNNNNVTFQQNTQIATKPSLYRKESVDSMDANFPLPKQEENTNLLNQHGNNYSNSSPPQSPNRIENHSSSLSIGSMLSNRNNSVKNNNNNNNRKETSNDNENPVLSSSSSVLSQKSEHLYNNNNHMNGNHSFNFNNHAQLQHAKSITDESSAENNAGSNGHASVNRNNSHPISGHGSRMLVRQATDLTSSFPLKPFQKINSETVEIPGLNVKVVRYRIENDLGKIEPHLYIKYNSGGVDSSQIVSKGKVFFSLRYNEEIQSFSVTINKAELLHNSSGANPVASFNPNASISAPNSPNINKPDTYVKIQLLPDKKRKFQTRIQRKTVAPLFEETFYFQSTFEDLQNKTLYLALFEFGRFSKHELIGAVRLNDLHLIKDLNNNDVEFTRSLIPLAEEDLELGELTLTLCYLPAAGRLTVTVVKALNLKAMDINGKSDPYVKVTLVSRGKRIKKKKTSVMKNTLHPVFNESMLFDIPQEQIEQVDMIVKVIDYDRVGSNELIGCVGIGPSFNGIGRDHWYRMLENPRKPMTQTYYLRDSSFLREGLPARIEKALNSDRQESLDSRSSDY